MISHLGKYKVLEAMRESPHGYYLAIDEEEILLPNKYCDGVKVGDKIEVFIYKDSEDRPVASKDIPFLTLGETKMLEVVEKVPFGVFVDMGLEKHLLIPKTEMIEGMEIGKKYLVRLMLDFRTERLVGIAKIESFSSVPESLELNDPVEGTVYQKTDLGFKIWTDLDFIGLVYHNQIFEPITMGDRVKCFVDEIRVDGKVDLRIKEGGLASIDQDALKVHEHLLSNDGKSTITDKSSPELIKMEFGMSKKAFKKAVGTLYKKKIITLEPDSIRLV